MDQGLDQEMIKRYVTFTGKDKRTHFDAVVHTTKKALAVAEVRGRVKSRDGKTPIMILQRWSVGNEPGVFHMVGYYAEG